MSNQQSTRTSTSCNSSEHACICSWPECRTFRKIFWQRHLQNQQQQQLQQRQPNDSRKLRSLSQVEEDEDDIFAGECLRVSFPGGGDSTKCKASSSSDNKLMQWCRCVAQSLNMLDQLEELQQRGRVAIARHHWSPQQLKFLDGGKRPSTPLSRDMSQRVSGGEFVLDEQHHP